MKTSLIVILTLIVLFGAGLFILIQTGVVANVFDPCERTFTDCNHGCGEGILNSICKETCAYDYRVCGGK